MKTLGNTAVLLAALGVLVILGAGLRINFEEGSSGPGAFHEVAPPDAYVVGPDGQIEEVHPWQVAPNGTPGSDGAGVGHLGKSPAGLPQETQS